MGYVAVDNLAQGMILEENVYDVNTRLLLSKGQKLAHNHIRILKIWGIPAVDVVGVDPAARDREDVFDDEKTDGLKSAIQCIFKNADFSDDTLKAVCKVALIHRIKGGASRPSRSSDLPDGRDGAAPAPPDKINRRIGDVEGKLPETPTIISELNQVIADPMATSNDVARVVSMSPSLATTLLKLVNSAYYGFPSKIDRISRAVTIIGTKEISSLALGISVMQAFKNIPKQVIDMQAFIRHSLACGIIGRILAARSNLPQTEQMFVAGLLHDIGKLIVYSDYPEHAAACFRMANASDTSVFHTEKQVVGIDHTQLAKRLLVKWKLPAELTDAITCHHAPARAANPENAGIVHLSDIITHGLGIGYSGERAIPHFDYARMAAAAGSRHSIPTIVRQTVHQLRPMETIFQGQVN